MNDIKIPDRVDHAAIMQRLKELEKEQDLLSVSNRFELFLMRQSLLNQAFCAQHEIPE